MWTLVGPGEQYPEMSSFQGYMRVCIIVGCLSTFRSCNTENETLKGAKIVTRSKSTLVL